MLSMEERSRLTVLSVVRVLHGRSVVVSGFTLRWERRERD